MNNKFTSFTYFDFFINKIFNNFCYFSQKTAFTTIIFIKNKKEE